MVDPWVKDHAARTRVTRIVRARRQPCAICSEPINYALRYPNPRSFSVQHVQSRKARPDLIFDPMNCIAAHLDCNKSQKQEPVITHRVTSRRW